MRIYRKSSLCAALTIAVTFAAVLALTPGVPTLAQSSEPDPEADRKSKLILVGTAGYGSVYFPTGTELCRVLNRNILTSGYRCIALTSGGAIYNIHAVSKAQLQMAITTDDMLEDAFLGAGVFEDAPLPNLRVIMPLYENPFSIIVRADSPYHKLEDLIGKKVNIGSRGAGRHIFGKFLFRTKGLKDEDFAELTAYGSALLKPALCRGETDAILQLIGYPSSFYDTLHAHCPVRIISLDEATIAALREQRPLLSKVTLEYLDSDGETQTWDSIATKGMLFTATNSMSSEEIGDLLKQFNDNIEYLHKNSSITYPVPKSGSIPHTAVPFYKLLWL